MDRLTDAQRDLARRHFRLAIHRTRPFQVRHPDLSDDLESDACLALMRAAQAYDPDRGESFPPLAREAIRNALIDVIRRRARRQPALLGDEVRQMGVRDGATLTERIDAVESWLVRLPERHAAVCRGIYLQEQRQADIGRSLGILRCEVARYHRESLNLLAGRPIETPLRKGA